MINDEKKNENDKQDQEIIEKELKKSTDKEEPGSAKSHGEILSEQLTEAQETYKKNPLGTFWSALIAGLEVGFSFLLLCTLFSFFISRNSEAAVFKIMSLVYPAGFILVISGKSLLFTEQTYLLSLPVFHKKESIFSL